MVPRDAIDRTDLAYKSSLGDCAAHGQMVHGSHGLDDFGSILKEIGLFHHRNLEETLAFHFHAIALGPGSIGHMRCRVLTS